MIYTNIKIALSSIKTTKTRSMLTMLGVIIGVFSVVMIVSLGIGVKNQVVGQISSFGSDVITIRPGRPAEPSSLNRRIRINMNSLVGTSTLTTNDVDAVKKITGVANASASSLITGNISSFETPNYNNGLIMATDPETPAILNLTIEYGEFFGPGDVTRNTVVIGYNIAQDLYHQKDPIGRIISIKGQDFIIRGVLAATPVNPLNLGTDFNDIIYMPFGSAKNLINAQPQISEINIKVAKGYDVAKVGNDIQNIIYKNHNNQRDFMDLNQSGYLDTANQIFNLLTGFVAAIAAISLLVGGIGIMNIMLVSVSERTREIGVRKAVGATNGQILGQFLIESVIISVCGGIAGIALSALAVYILRTTTDFKPVMSLPTAIIATGVSTIVGVVFGMTPAIKASRKDPIQSLRHE